MITLTNGILFFAYNNETVNYAEIANINAMLIKKHMKINNITVITDKETKKFLDPSLYEHIMINESSDINRRTLMHADKLETVNWKNTTRSSAYELSPYDNTLLLDVDYLIFNNWLDTVFKLPNIEFASAYDAYDISNKHMLTDKVGDIHMLWATIIYFKKGHTAELYFDYMKHIKDNYKYYSQLYGFTVRNFRNDYALTIANKEIITWTDKIIPNVISMICTVPTHTIIDNFNGSGGWTYKNGQYYGRIRGISLHIMNKHVILKFKNEIINYATSAT